MANPHKKKEAPIPSKKEGGGQAPAQRAQGGKHRNPKEEEAKQQHPKGGGGTTTQLNITSVNQARLNFVCEQFLFFFLKKKNYSSLISYFIEKKNNGRPTHRRLRKQHQGRGEKAPPPTLGGVTFIPSPFGWCCLPLPPLRVGLLSLPLIRVVVLSSLRPLGRCFFFSGTSTTHKRRRKAAQSKEGRPSRPTKKGGRGKQHLPKGRRGESTTIQRRRRSEQHHGGRGIAPPPTLGGVAFSLSFWVVLPFFPLPCGWSC